MVVDFGSNVVLTSCINFVETQLTGYDVLNRSGFSIVVAQSSGQGTAVCKINNTGCSANPCFCAMPLYWSYWHQTNGAWSYSTSGASSAIVLPGAVEGWSWGSAPPKVIPLAEICLAPTATATVTPPSPTAKPVDEYRGRTDRHGSAKQQPDRAVRDTIPDQYHAAGVADPAGTSGHDGRRRGSSLTLALSRGERGSGGRADERSAAANGHGGRHRQRGGFPLTLSRADRGWGGRGRRLAHGEWRSGNRGRFRLAHGEWRWGDWRSSPTSGSLAGYAAFGAIAVGLLGYLALGAWRRR